MTLSLRTSPLHAGSTADAPWWRDAVIYQVYPRSWADSDGDGVGDLPGITARLPHLAALGVDAVWFSPFYVSPMNDGGYDVADYRDIDPLFGTLDDVEAMMARAAELGIKVIVDLVPNHTSSEHEWFQAALTAGPGSPERERYVFREGSGDGSEPPNDWRSVFGGGAWSRVTEADGSPGQWYLHLFDVTQPDLSWENPEVRAEFESILRFWLDRGVAGFRVDVAHGLIKAEGLPPFDHPAHMLHVSTTNESPYWDQEGVHEIYRSWRRVVDEYADPQRILCAEAWVKPLDRLARYVRDDEMHQAFNFDYLDAHWDADQLREVIEDSLRANDAVGAPSTWVLSNHDVLRHASRLGIDQHAERPNGIAADDPQPDAALGLRRARAATTLMLALPGGAYLYQGEELGLPEHTTLPHEYRQDPTFARTEGQEVGRDGCRVPMPWAKGEPAFGFSPTGESWLPQPEVYRELAVDQQEGVPGSTLELYRDLLRLRKERRLGRGSLAHVDGYPHEVVAFVLDDPAERTLVILNMGADPVELPEGAQIILASGEVSGGLVPTDTAVWATLPDGAIG